MNFAATSGRHPDGIVDAETDEPAEQEIVVELLHQLALGTDRVERLQERRAQELLGRDRGPAFGCVTLRELSVERRQRVVHDLTNLAQAVLLALAPPNPRS